MVKVTLKTLLIVTLVNTLMASLVVLVEDLVRIAFANVRITVIPQFAKFIGKNFGLKLYIHGKNRVLLLSRMYPVTLSLVKRHLFHPHPFLNTVWAVVVM